MTNPVIHALVVLAAIIIPGGLIVYFAWRVRNKCQDVKAAKLEAYRRDPIEEIREAYLKQFPIESLREKNRRERLDRARARRRRKFTEKDWK